MNRIQRVKYEKLRILQENYSKPLQIKSTLMSLAITSFTAMSSFQGPVLYNKVLRTWPQLRSRGPSSPHLDARSLAIFPQIILHT